MTLRFASNAAEIATALAASIGGDIVECATGDYGHVSFDGYAYTSMVTVRSALFAFVQIQEATTDAVTKFVRFENIEFYTVNPGTNDGVAALHITSSHDIQCYGCTFKGDFYFDATDNAWFPGMRGVNVWFGATDILFDHCVIQDAYISFLTIGSVNVTCRHVEITRFGSDGYLLNEDVNFLIDDCKTHAPTGEPSSGGAHLDMCQVQATASTVPWSGTIQNSIWSVVGGIWTQMLFLGNENPALPLGPITVSGNLIYASFIWGIGVGRCDNLAINANTVIRDFAVPGDPAFPSLDKPQILPDAGGATTTLDNNVAHQIQAAGHPETNTTILGYSQVALDAEFDANLTKLPGRLVGKGASIDLLWGGAPPAATPAPPQHIKLGAGNGSLMIAPGELLYL